MAGIHGDGRALPQNTCDGQGPPAPGPRPAPVPQLETKARSASIPRKPYGFPFLQSDGCPAAWAMLRCVRSSWIPVNERDCQAIGIVGACRTDCLEWLHHNVRHADDRRRFSHECNKRVHEQYFQVGASSRLSSRMRVCPRVCAFGTNISCVDSILEGGIPSDGMGRRSTTRNDVHLVEGRDWSRRRGWRGWAVVLRFA